MSGGARGRGGFTLLEVLVALVILAGGIAALASMFSGSLRLSSAAGDVSNATVYASQRMEEALLDPAPKAGDERGRFGERFRWRLETEIGEGGEKEPSRPVSFTVTVSWDDGAGERSVRLDATRWEKKRESPLQF